MQLIKNHIIEAFDRVNSLNKRLFEFVKEEIKNGNKKKIIIFGLLLIWSPIALVILTNNIIMRLKEYNYLSNNKFSEFITRYTLYYIIYFLVIITAYICDYLAKNIIHFKVDKVKELEIAEEVEEVKEVKKHKKVIKLPEILENEIKKVKLINNFINEMQNKNLDFKHCFQISKKYKDHINNVLKLEKIRNNLNKINDN
jgi:hypothetical protein